MNLPPNRIRILLMSFLVIYFLVMQLSLGYEPYAKWMTYRNFDITGEINFIYFLLPGIEDQTSHTVYSFDKIHYLPLILFFGVLAPSLFLFRITRIKNQKNKIYFNPKTKKSNKLCLKNSHNINRQNIRQKPFNNKLVNYRKSLIEPISLKRAWIQFASFLIARLGIIRVSGICPISRSGLGIFPFLNCQSCELASGGCPIGMVQMAVRNHSFPSLTIMVLNTTGLIMGRFVCGWLCPFGFLSEIMHRFSLRKRLPNWIHKIKYAALFFLALSMLFIYYFPNISALPFCAYMCPAGFFYGVLPFSVTTGFSGLANSMPLVHVTFIYQILLAISFLLLIRIYSGWIFCISLCPIGAFLSLFNKISFMQIYYSKTNCKNCGSCSKACPMQTDPTINDFFLKSSCIGCGICIDQCRHNALSFSRISDNNVNTTIFNDAVLNTMKDNKRLFDKNKRNNHKYISISNLNNRIMNSDFNSSKNNSMEVKLEEIDYDNNLINNLNHILESDDESTVLEQCTLNNENQPEIVSDNIAFFNQYFTGGKNNETSNNNKNHDKCTGGKQIEKFNKY